MRRAIRALLAWLRLLAWLHDAPTDAATDAVDCSTPTRTGPHHWHFQKCGMSSRNTVDCALAPAWAEVFECCFCKKRETRWRA